MILCISMVSLVTSPYCNCIDLSPLTVFSLMSLAKVLSILFIFPKNQLLVSLLFSIFVSILLISTLIFIFSFLLALVNLEIKRCFLFGRKAVTNLDSVLKSRDITLPTKVHIVKAMDFPVVMYGCESWTIKKAERWRIDAFNLWCWRRLLRVPWLQGDQTRQS